MIWEEARNMYVNKWVLIETIDAYSEEGRRVEATKIENSFPIFEMCLSPFRYCKRSEQYLLLLNIMNILLRLN
jgi:hypothetical protein